MSAPEAGQWGDAATVAACSQLVWGAAGPSADTLSRWLQGFQFSEREPTALLQHRGGPCAVITAVQAHMIRLALFKYGCARPQDFDGEPAALLTEALAAVLAPLAADGGRVRLLFPAEVGDAAAAAAAGGLHELLGRLGCTDAEDESLLEPLIMSVLPQLCGELGLVALVYSAVLTAGVDRVRRQVADEDESLVDPRSGNGSQALLNLLATGVATPHAFDGVKDLDGLHMQGIAEQPSIGFLTLLEALRYCEVGWHLKNPRYPVWIVGSETHLTVVFSNEARLIQTDGKYHQADRAFQRLDTGGSGFLAADRLEELMRLAELQLPPSCQTLAELRAKLDPEGLQVIIRDNFLRTFFPDAQPAYPSRFAIYHLNNLVKGGDAAGVAYSCGRASIGQDLLAPPAAAVAGKEEEAEEEDGDKAAGGAAATAAAAAAAGGGSGSGQQSDLMRVLHTKWPTLRVVWDSGRLPSVY